MRGTPVRRGVSKSVEKFVKYPKFTNFGYFYLQLVRGR